MSTATHTPTGHDLKLAGQALALFNEPEAWVDRFISIAREYLASLPDGALFAIEDVRAYAEAHGLPALHTHKVWGSLPRVMMREGLPLAQTDRSRKARSPKTHAHRVMLWAKTGRASA